MESIIDSINQLVFAIHTGNPAEVENVLARDSVLNYKILGPALRYAVDYYCLIYWRRDAALRIIKKLMADGANATINNQDYDFTNEPLLMRAARAEGGGDRYELLNYLLSCGANPNLQNKLGATALMIVVGCADYEEVSYLLRQGADIRLACNMHKTALDYAYDARSYKKEEANKIILLLKKNN